MGLFLAFLIEAASVSNHSRRNPVNQDLEVETQLTHVEMVIFGACVGAALFILSVAIYS
jgi:hypothetical protein